MSVDQRKTKQKMFKQTGNANETPLGTNKILQNRANDEEMPLHLNTIFYQRGTEMDANFRRSVEGDGYGPGSLYAHSHWSLSEQEQSSEKLESPLPGLTGSSNTLADRKRARCVDQASVSHDIPHRRSAEASDIPLRKRIRRANSEPSPFADELPDAPDESTISTAGAVPQPTLDNKRSSTNHDPFGCGRVDLQSDALSSSTFSKPFESTATPFQIPETPTSPPLKIESPAASPAASPTASPETSQLLEARPRDPRRHASNLLRTQDADPRRTSDLRLIAEFVDLSSEAYAARLTIVDMPDKIVDHEEYSGNAKLMTLDRLRHAQAIKKDLDEKLATTKRVKAERKRREKEK